MTRTDVVDQPENLIAHTCHVAAEERVVCPEVYDDVLCIPALTGPATEPEGRLRTVSASDRESGVESDARVKLDRPPPASSQLIGKRGTSNAAAEQHRVAEDRDRPERTRTGQIN